MENDFIEKESKEIYFIDGKSMDVNFNQLMLNLGSQKSLYLTFAMFIVEIFIVEGPNE